MRNTRFLGILLVGLIFSSCKLNSSGSDWESKVKFDLELVRTSGDNSKLLGYSFCVPNQPVLVEQVRQIHSELEVVDQPQKACDSLHFLCRFHPVQPGHMAHLERIAKLSYIEEIHPVWR